MNRRVTMDLREIAFEARRVADEIDAGEFDEHGEMAFAGELEHLLYHLTLAWHRSKLTDDELDRLTTEQVQTMAASIPRFNLDYRLVDM